MVRLSILFSGMALFLGVALTISALPANAGSNDAAAEQQILQLINQARTAQGLLPVRENAQLQAAARAHSQLMASQEKLSHQLPGEPILRKRLALAGVRFHTDGETVGSNQSVPAAQQGFMHSPPHRTIVLDSQYDAVGIGVVEQNGTVWVTEDFARLRKR